MTDSGTIDDSVNSILLLKTQQAIISITKVVLTFSLYCNDIDLGNKVIGMTELCKIKNVLFFLKSVFQI